MPRIWTDGIIIQAVADQLQLKLIIAGAHERYQEYSLVQPVLSTQQVTDIYQHCHAIFCQVPPVMR